PEPTPEPTPEPPIDSTPNALGIREIPTDDAFTRLEYAPGELIDEEASIYFLDVETGAVEGWKVVAGVEPFFSHGYRYAATDAALHDRETGRTFAWDADALQVAGFEEAPWRVSTGSYSTFISDESVAFQRLDGADDSGVQRYVIVDPSMNEIAAFEIPSYWDILQWNLAAGSALASDGTAMHIIDVSTGSSFAIDQPDTPRPPASGEWFASVGYAGEYADLEGGGSVAGAQGSCQAVRRDWGSGAVLSDTTVDCFLGGGAGAHLSPDGALLAAVTRVLDCCDEWFGHAFYSALTALSLFDATTGDELLRVGGATFPFRQGVGYGAVWLADSSGLVVATVQGLQIVTVDGRWVPLSPVLSQGHLRPSPVDPGRFIHDGSATVVDLSGEVVVTPNFEESVPLARSAWNPSGQELRLLPEVPGKGASPLAPSTLPAIQTPPFDDALTAEVVVDTCLNVREEATTDSEIVVCLPPERVVELVAHPDDGHLVEGPCVEDDLYGNCVWVYVLTEDGEQGWAYADFLRWSGIPLAPAPDPPAPRG
ncbi:MAG: SH3 domain-containing protein, partial [Chloroflexota bacterium]|nr:SH3 domain-containing protein [Chloroflexota bacterium]